MSSATITELSISAVTLASGWFIGNKSVWGQRLAVFANIGWWFYIIAFQHWGLAPMEVGFTIIVIRALIKWEKEAKHGQIK
jgi:hypothetical protein